MTVFLTKVWGFDIPSGPLQFNSQGWRKNAREKLKVGDLVVYVGTAGDKTHDEDRGRVLGMVEPTTEIVMSIDFEIAIDKARDYDNDGKYRWPYGLLIHRAWKFPDKPLLKAITERRFGTDSACGIVQLTDEEAKSILLIPHEEVPVLTSLRAIARVESPEAARRKGAPPPATSRRGVMHLRKSPAYTYAMVVEGAKGVGGGAFKIGWAFDVDARAREFNLASLPKLGGVRYLPIDQCFWPTARQAFQMEQAVLGRFDAHRHPSNREVLCGITKEELRKAWGDIFLELRR